ncbi:MAG: serine/threonine protein kinase [Stigonema ocellatum SAG 48.90 = DSM 106950]|nr:serine/threonine protein kinase [Stigonema ocellatum SAG 48.90 = DSM 106950]
MCYYFKDMRESFQSPDDSSVPERSLSNTLLNDRYRILKPLGQGGFGKTFLAVDEKCQVQTRNIRSFGNQTPQLCVIKQFFPQRHTIDHQKASKLFHQESLHLAELGNHPQIPQLLNTFVEDGQQYLVQEWIDGQTLEEELAEAGAFNEAEIRQLLLALLPVLQFVHKHEVIHRDIKPGNIIRRQSDRQLVIVDFGAAKFAAGEMLSKTGTLIGSAEYAAPEQIRGKAVFASDLYSLGVTCLHLLTEMPPFDLYDCGENTWIWRPYLREPISPSLEQILCKLLQGATKRRYPSATEVLKDVNALAKHIVVPSAPEASKRTDYEDFESPYFGFSGKENLPASITPYAAALDIHAIASITFFDPQTQGWYYLPPKIEASEIVRKVTVFLGPRLAAAACQIGVRDKMSLPGSNKTVLKPRKILLWVTRAIAAISLTCLILEIQALGK